MKSILIAQLAHLIGRSLPIATDTEARAYDQATDIILGGRKPRRLSDCTSDPYFEIKTVRRQDATNSLRLQQQAFEQTRVGKRNARGRGLSNPFTLDKRRKAFDAALASGETRKAAWRIARRVAA